ncbi:hypothetical protein D621_07455 [beta proteobacterium AAP51]|nr:hypothetical protein D621_07455 [beta proteobacterium AAP51]
MSPQQVAQLIEQGCARYARETAARYGLHFELEVSVREQIYANGVFPAQGTRPLFSSIHAILGAGLAKAALWALECGAEPGDCVGLTADGRSLIASWRGRSHTIAAPFEINRLRQRSNADFRALLAVHEAGHGLVHALLFGRAPHPAGFHLHKTVKTTSALTSKPRARRSRRCCKPNIHAPPNCSETIAVPCSLWWMNCCSRGR